jgi:hypothetical protein
MESAAHPNAGARSRACGVVAKAGRSHALGCTVGCMLVVSEAAHQAPLTVSYIVVYKKHSHMGVLVMPT